MAETYKTIGGMDVPIGVPDYQAYLMLARFGWVPSYWYKHLGERKTAVELGYMHPSDAIIHAVRGLFARHEFELHTWSERMLQALADQYETVAFVGAGSCGKSESAGLWALLMWVLAPKSTAIFLISTTTAQLRRRSFSAVARYHAILKKRGLPGMYSRQHTMIVNEDEMDDRVSSADIKTGIIGIASQAGKSEEEAASRLGGVHLATPVGSPSYAEDFIGVIVDEAQACPEAIMKAGINLRSGCSLFRTVVLGNIFSRSGNVLADYCTPRGGWSTIDMDTERWENERESSITLRFDGYKSPAVVEEDGESKYPYLIGPTHIRSMLNAERGEETSAYFLSMARAWPSDSDGGLVVLPKVDQSRFKANEKVEWAGATFDELFVGIDPAWTAGGDKAVLSIVEYGIMRSGLVGINIREPSYLTISANSQVPVQYQLSSQIIRILKEYGIPLYNVAFDESASQLLADVVLAESADRNPIRVNFSSKATENFVSVFSEQKCRERYANIITEMYFRVAEFAMHGHLRGLTGPAAQQFASRQIIPDKRPIRLEQKALYKARLRLGSPDEADSVALAAHAMSVRTGFLPGATVHNPRGGISFRTQAPRQSVDYDEINYSEQESY